MKKEFIEKTIEAFNQRFNHNGAYNHEGLVIKYCMLDEYQLEGVSKFLKEKLQQAIEQGKQEERNTPITNEQYNHILKEYKQDLKAWAEEQKRNTEDNGEGCVSCGLDHYECKCHIHNIALDDLIQKLND